MSDGQVFLGITSDRHWRRFCRTFGYADLGADARLATNQGRIDQHDWLLPELAGRLSRLTREKVMQLSAEANIPFAPVVRPADLFADPQLNLSGSLMETPLAPEVTVKMPRIPLRMNDHEFDLRQPAPKVGEGGRRLLAEIGLSEKHVARLQAEGVVGPLE